MANLTFIGPSLNPTSRNSVETWKNPSKPTRFSITPTTEFTESGEMRA
jgi:hypothetical protein